MLSRRRYYEALKLFGALGIRVLIPLIVLAIWQPSLTRSIFYYSTSRIQLPNTPDGLFPHFLNAFGWEAAFVGVLGMGFFIYRSDFLLRGLVLPAVAVVLAFFVEFYPKFFIGPPPLYNRSWIMLGVLLAIFGDFGGSSGTRWGYLGDTLGTFWGQSGRFLGASVQISAKHFFSIS